MGNIDDFHRYAPTGYLTPGMNKQFQYLYVKLRGGAVVMTTELLSKTITSVANLEVCSDPCQDRLDGLYIYFDLIDREFDNMEMLLYEYGYSGDENIAIMQCITEFMLDTLESENEGRKLDYRAIYNDISNINIGNDDNRTLPKEIIGVITETLINLCAVLYSGIASKGGCSGMQQMTYCNVYREVDDEFGNSMPSYRLCDIRYSTLEEEMRNIRRYINKINGGKLDDQ